MNQPDTCGQGLAERSAVPAKLGALTAAMADNLEKHQRTLDLTDNNAETEHEAYEVVASDLRNAAAQLQAAAERMAGYRGLPMARHDEHAIRSREIRDAFAGLIEREQDLSALLNTLIEQDRAMLGSESAGAGSPDVAAAAINAKNTALTRAPITKTGMLIRKPVGEVFDAIVNPDITTTSGLRSQRTPRSR